MTAGYSIPFYLIIIIIVVGDGDPLCNLEIAVRNITSEATSSQQWGYVGKKVFPLLVSLLIAYQ